MRAAAASAGGFSGVGVHIDDVDEEDEGELARRDDVLRRTGLSVAEVEFISGWTGGELPRARTKAFRLAAHWGAHHVSIGEFTGGALDPPTASSVLADLAAEAAEHSVTLALEAFPWSRIDSYPRALELIEASGAGNVGLLVDVWHFFNTGAKLSFLDHLECSRIAAVQLNDGPRVHNDFLQQARRARMLPGQGELGVHGLLERLLALGYTGPWFVEVSTPEFRALGARDAAEQAVTAARRAVEAARQSSVTVPSN
ncbi:sugar phosphate isomerase/epimerase [Sinomonas sp. JGH33]|uniref:Sugar phosphate isomerase/epimerase n=1 Tax=Sinomonas terricola TaxID=3110330 RepID=A0ABU5TBF8_9MICC|nr:sugar phosphate isomerase/epimerase [Sinomonas sp. JGH33]MEA5457018.1 sugar phosphate isomerase/epimerase [Sinomonas sp. JGH33]